MDHLAVFAAVEQLEEKYIQVWQEMCSIESPSTFKEGVDAVGAYCIQKAKEMGWQVEKGSEPVSGDPVCITMNPNSKEAPLCLSGHMDTVHPVGAFGDLPVHIDQTHIYGPGVRDCKGGIVAGLMVMEALQMCGYTKRPVKLILQSDEENSSATSDKHTVDFMEEKAKGCIGFLNLESYTQNKVTVQRKGIMKFRFDISGKSGHAGQCFKYVSAIAEAANKILQIEKWKEKDGVTCNVGTITGGTGINVVPEKCSFTVDVRFPNAQRQEQIKAYLQEVADRSFVEGACCQLTLVSTRVAMPRTEENIALLERINAALEKAGLPTVTPSMAPGGSDCSDLVSRGIVGLDSLGIEGADSHSPKERAELASLVRCGKRLAAIAWYL